MGLGRGADAMTFSHAEETNGLSAELLSFPNRGYSGGCGEALGFAEFFMQSSFKFYAEKMRGSDMQADVMAEIITRIEEGCAVEHGLPLFAKCHTSQRSSSGAGLPTQKNKGSPDSEAMEDSGGARQAQFRILHFWRCILDSVRDVVLSSMDSAQEHNLDTGSIYVEDLFAAPSLANTFFRSRAVRKLITKVTEKELMDRIEKEKRKAVITVARIKKTSNAKKRTPSLSIIGRAAFEDDHTSSSDDEAEESEHFDGPGRQKRPDRESEHLAKAAVVVERSSLLITLHTRAIESRDDGLRRCVEKDVRAEKPELEKAAIGKDVGIE